MNVFHITQTEIERDWQWLFEAVTSCMDKLAMMLVQHDVTVPCIPKRVAGRLVPYSFCGQIMLMLDYVKDNRVVSKTLVEENTTLFYQIMTMNVASFLQKNAEDDIDDDDESYETAQIQMAEKYIQMLDFIATLRPHPIAVIILAANAKLKISKSQWLSAAEMEAISGINAETAAQLGIASRTVQDKIIFNPNDIQKKIYHSEDINE